MSDTPQEQPRKEISAEGFIKIWKGEYRNKEEFKDCYQKNWRGDELVVFEDYKVIGDIKIKELKKLPNLELRNSETTSFSIDNSTTGFFWIWENSTTGYFDIANSTTGSFIIQDNSTTGSFSIRDNSTTDYFSIRENSTTGSFTIQDNSTTGSFTIQENSTTGYFDIANSTTGNFRIKENSTTHYLDIANSTTGYFNIANSTTGNFRIKENSTTGNFNIANSTMGNFDIANSTTGDFRIRDNSTVRSMNVTKSNIETIRIENDVHIGTLELKYITAESKRLIILGSVVERLFLQLDRAYHITINSFGSIANNNYRQAEIYHIDFKEVVFPQNAYLQVSDSLINVLELNSFINHGTIVFNNMQPIESPLQPKDEYLSISSGIKKKEKSSCNSKIVLVNSDLGNLQFIGSDLSVFDEFIFFNTKMLDVFIAGTELPNYHKIETIPKSIEKKMEQRRLAFGQIKKLYDNQGDVVRALELRSDEMESYRLYLQQTNIDRFKNKWYKRAELINLWLNSKTNKYSTNWLQAVIVTLILNWILFSAYCLNKGYDFDIHGNTDTFLTLFSHSFAFLNPIHKADFLDEVTKVDSNWSRWIDYIGRIVMAYMIYQTVAAFRKFGRKSA